MTRPILRNDVSAVMPRNRNAASRDSMRSTTAAFVVLWDIVYSSSGGTQVLSSM